MPRILHNKLHGVTTKTVILKFLIQMYVITLLSSLNILPIISPVREPVRDLIPQSLAIRSMEIGNFLFLHVILHRKTWRVRGGGEGLGCGMFTVRCFKGTVSRDFLWSKIFYLGHFWTGLKTVSRKKNSHGGIWWQATIYKYERFDSRLQVQKKHTVLVYLNCSKILL